MTGGHHHREARVGMAEFIRVCGVEEVPDPGRTLVDVDGELVALFHVEGGLYAIDDVCTHDGGPLADGELVGHAVACPRHGARFDVRTGAALTMPAIRATRSHEVKIQDGSVWVRLRSTVEPSPPPVGPQASPVGPQASPSAAQPTESPPPVAVTRATEVDAAQAPIGELSEDLVREMLKEVKDPELFVNIVDLGLIYGVTITPASAVPDRQHVAIDMTMTSPACPAGPQLIADTKRAVSQRPDVAQVEVRIVMDPPWSPDRMTDAARDQLGIF
jgi:metal-sulfur cluster biosynthetic enzyme/nitrite reductase/ring-hydroxylating ferredoxin subunit